ncbi:hypothetical protein [Streptomyces filamentosus]|uniref:hypothetical protein n=1 Tax=Streptomyces filamentosus TaxID=67294 RepID=UPI00331C6FA5
MTDAVTWLAAPRSVAFGGYFVVLARGLSPDGLAHRLAEAVRYGDGHVVEEAGEHTGASLLELMDDEYGDPLDGLGLRLGRTGEWVYAIGYGGWQGEFEVAAGISRGGADVFLLEYEEENGKPVPPRFARFRDGRLRAACNLHLDPTWGYRGVEGDPAEAGRLEEAFAAAGLPDPDRPRDEVHHLALGVVGEFFGLSLPRRAVLAETLQAVLLEPA